MVAKYRLTLLFITLSGSSVFYDIFVFFIKEEISVDPAAPLELKFCSFRPVLVKSVYI